DHSAAAGWERMTPKERRDTGTMTGFWWFLPTDPHYRATSHLPRVWYERMAEFGLDFCVVFPTLAIGFFLPGIVDDELRRASVRGYNLYASEMYRGLEDRLAPAAAIPMNTPEEAIAELEFCVKELGLKAAMFPSYVVRPITRDAGNQHIPKGRLAPFHLDLY